MRARTFHLRMTSVLRHITVVAAFSVLSGASLAQDFRNIEWYAIESSSVRAQAIFPEADGIPAPSEDGTHQVLLADIDHPDGPVSLAIWAGPVMCGQTCGLKILDRQDRIIGGGEACREPEQITIASDLRTLSLCGPEPVVLNELIWGAHPSAAALVAEIPASETTAPALTAAPAGHGIPSAVSESIAPMPDVIYMDHNGSVMAVSPAAGTITYAQVRQGLRDIIADGTVLFRGRPWTPGETFEGVAHTFRQGCDPAPYRVTASYEGFTQVLTLRGPAPVRVSKGCRVVDYSAESGNAVLQFHTTFD